MKPLHRYGLSLVAPLLLVRPCISAILPTQSADRSAIQDGIPVLVDERIGWQKANIRSLRALSVLGQLSPEEQVSLANAGSNIDRLQQALMDLHEQRLVYWQGALRAATQKRRKSGGQFASTEERQAQANVERFAGVQNKIRDWQPVTFRSYVSKAVQGSETAATPAASYRPVSQPTSSGVKQRVPTASGSLHSTVSSDTHLGAIAKPAVQIARPAVQAVSVASVQTASIDEQSSVHAQVWQALGNWATAIETNDAAREAECYGEHLDRYFLRHDVTHAFVRDYLKAWVQERDHRVMKFVPMGVTFEDETPDRTRIRLIKQVVMSQSGEDKERLISSKLEMSKVNGRWKITSEQDLK